MAEAIDEETALAALETHLSGESPVTPPVAEVVPPVEVVTPEAGAEPAIPPVEEPVTPAAEEEPGAPERIRIGKLPEADRYRMAAAVNLASAEGISIDDAMARLAPAKAEPVTPVVDPAEAVNAELATVQQTLDAAAQDESLLTPAVLAAFDRKAELREQLRDIEHQKTRNTEQQAQAAQQTWGQQWDKSVAWAEKHFDEAKDPQSALCQAVGTELDAISNDLRHPLYGKADLPQLLFAKHAADLGIAPNKKTAALAKPPAQRLLPAGGGLQRQAAPVNNPATQQAQFKQREAQALAEGDDDALARLADEEISGAPPPRHSVLAFA